MPADRRSPAIFSVLAVLLLVVPLGIAGWWWYRPAPDLKGNPADEPDIVCSGRVDVPAQVISLEPSIPSRVVEVLVEEGQAVKKGQPILAFDDSVAQHRKTQAEASVELARVELRQAMLDEDRFPIQIDARESLMKAASARVEAAEKMFEQRKSQGGVTPLGKAEMEAIQAQIRELQLFEKAQIAEFKDLKELKEISPKIRVSASEQKLRAVKADLDLAQKTLDECKLLAPSDGTILRLQASAGGIVSPGGFPTAVIFAPSMKLIVRAELDQEYLGRVREGMSVTVQDDNRTSGGERTGKITGISKWVAQRRTVLLEPGEINDVRTLECIIELDPMQNGDKGRLFIGQRMRVRIQSQPR